MKGCRQPETKVVVWPRVEGDWKPHPHVSSSQRGKKGLWGQRSERGLLAWNMRMWAGLEGRGACGKAFRSFWEPSQWDVALGHSEALEWCVGRMLPCLWLTQLSSGFWALGCCKLDGPRWSENPFTFLPASVGRRVVARDVERPWDESERHLRLLWSNRSSIPSASRAAYRGDPRTETELDRVLESSPLALGETFSTLVTLPYVEELTLTGCANGLPCSLIRTGLGPVGREREVRSGLGLSVLHLSLQMDLPSPPGRFPKRIYL